MQILSCNFLLSCKCSFSEKYLNSDVCYFVIYTRDLNKYLPSILILERKLQEGLSIKYIGVIEWTSDCADYSLLGPQADRAQNLFPLSISSLST